MRWFRRRNGGREAAREREERAQRAYEAAKRRTPQVRREAERIAELTAEEFAQRVARAYRGWA